MVEVTIAIEICWGCVRVEMVSERVSAFILSGELGAVRATAVSESPDHCPMKQFRLGQRTSDKW